MKAAFRAFAASGLLVAGLAGAHAALAQKQGGILRVYHRDSPASMSIHEEGTVGVIMPMMGVFNNLVIFDQHVPQNSMQSIVPELATSWAWSEDGTELTFKLRDGVKWHDGKPFTAEDVKCTLDLLTNQSKEKLRLNFRETWWVNVAKTTTNGDHEASIHLKRPQPALLALLASGDTPIYPCHVPPRDMRQHPIGTGPFKFVEYKPNQYIKIARNPDYWKPGRPYLDGVEYTIIPNRSTAILAFIAGKFDMTFPCEVTIPLLKDIKTQAPQATCEVGMASESIGMLVNRTVAPFDNPELRRAMALTLDRKSFIDILGQGEGEIGGALLPPSVNADVAWRVQCVLQLYIERASTEAAAVHRAEHLNVADRVQPEAFGDAFPHYRQELPHAFFRVRRIDEVEVFAFSMGEVGHQAVVDPVRIDDDRLSAACRKTSVKRTTGTEADAMISPRTLRSRYPPVSCPRRPSPGFADGRRETSIVRSSMDRLFWVPIARGGTVHPGGGGAAELR
jgi:ABC-type transport system substrate-binding protein